MITWEELDQANKDQISDMIDRLLCKVSWKDLQQRQIQAVLRKNNGNKSHAAKDLGISLRTLRSKVNGKKA